MQKRAAQSAPFCKQNREKVGEIVRNHAISTQSLYPRKPNEGSTSRNQICELYVHAGKQFWLTGTADEHR